MRKAVFALAAAAAAALVLMSIGTLYGGALHSSERLEMDPALALIDARRQQVTARRNLEARWAQNHASVPRPDVNLETTAPTAEVAPAKPAPEATAAALAAVQAPAEPAAVAKGPEGEASRKAAIEAGCEPERRPYHTILTSSSGTYQVWQSRIMYHHFKLQKVQTCATVLHCLLRRPHHAHVPLPLLLPVARSVRRDGRIHAAIDGVWLAGRRSHGRDPDGGRRGEEFDGLCGDQQAELDGPVPQAPGV